MAVDLQPIGARGTAGAVLGQLADAIRRGDFATGDTLPSERDLAGQLGVSRQTVRKAVRSLADADVVELITGQGARSGARVKTSFVPLELDRVPRAAPSIGEVAEILEARRLFEPRVAVLAGFMLTAEDYDRIADVIALQRRETTLDGIRKLDIRFHLAVAAATHNGAIVTLMQTLMSQIDIARNVVTLDESSEARDTIDIHERTLKAIASRNQASIETIMDEHMRMLEQAWEDASGHALPRVVPSFLLGSS
jgi:GntR family transcriptional repressor for pyruvate dehydrogenase complex